MLLRYIYNWSLLNSPENLREYDYKANEVWVLIPKYDVVSGQFLSLGETLGCTQKKLKNPNSFTTTLFRKHKLQYEEGKYLGSEFSNIFFFIPSTIDRIHNQYNGSVNLQPVDLIEFGENFDPSKLDYENSDRQLTKDIVLKVLKEVVQLSYENLRTESRYNFFRDLQLEKRLKKRKTKCLSAYTLMIFPITLTMLFAW